MLLIALKIRPGLKAKLNEKFARWRLIDYILSPIEEIGSTALRER